MCNETKTIERNLKEELNKFLETENVETGKQNLFPQKYITLLSFKPHHQFSI